MKIELLTHFYEVVESGSFRVAARNCVVNETAIKESIISLEIELGTRLIMCDNESKVVPTVEGLRILPIIKEIVVSIQEMEEELKSLNNHSNVNCNMMYDVSLI